MNRFETRKTENSPNMQFLICRSNGQSAQEKESTLFREIIHSAHSADRGLIGETEPSGVRTEEQQKREDASLNEQIEVKYN